MSHNTPESVVNLERAGVSRLDALALRRISMTLHRWHELECGDSNDYSSWTITRGRHLDNHGDVFFHDESGSPYIERHVHTEKAARFTRIPDRETGARKRLAAIMARYPTLQAYVQGDPRGAALYIIRPGDIRDGLAIDSCYSNGVAVYK